MSNRNKRRAVQQQDEEDSSSPQETEQNESAQIVLRRSPTTTTNAPPSGPVDVKGKGKAAEAAKDTAGVTCQELRATAKLNGFQVSRGVDRYLKDALPGEQNRELVYCIFQFAMDIARRNRRKRIMMRDVEPLVMMCKMMIKTIKFN